MYRLSPADLYSVDETDSITFGNKYQYNATSALTYDKNKKKMKGTLHFLSKVAQGVDKDFANSLKLRKILTEDAESAQAASDGGRAKTALPIKKPFHRSVNSQDVASLKDVKGKQIMFYSDLVDWNDLKKLFTVLDKTPSFTSLSICRERIRKDLNKIITYEEEIASLYSLIEVVNEYFELISFDDAKSMKSKRKGIMVNMAGHESPTETESNSNAVQKS